MFRRRRAETTGPAQDAASTDATADTRDVPAEVAPDRPDGPYDVSEVADPSEGGRVDLGGMWLPGRPGMELRVEVDKESQRVASVAAVLAGSALQLQPFAAPRREGIWDEVRRELADGIRGQGGHAEEVQGGFGTELRARVPVTLPDGATGTQPVRFVGVDGPRWFLRGVFSGAAHDDPEAAAPLEGILRGVVVVRGGEAMAPREPIPLKLPQRRDPEAGDATAAPAAEGPVGGRDALRPFERGPEITEVR